MNGPTREELEQVEKPETKAVGFEEWIKKELIKQGNSTYHECWEAAQAALIASGQYIRVPPVEEWPEWAGAIDVGFWEFYENTTAVSNENYCNLTRIKRPTPAWRPKEGDKIWFFAHGRKFPQLIMPICDPKFSTSCEMYAAAESLDEITWTREQFRQRGRFWESGK